MNSPAGHKAPAKLFDRSQVRLLPIAKRKHDLTRHAILPLSRVACHNRKLVHVARRIIEARQKKAACILMMGGHFIRCGLQRYLIDLMEKGFISCIAVNGAVVIHDFEFSLIGATTESVAKYIQTGQFGMWQETSRINDIVYNGVSQKWGIGYAVGKVIEGEGFPHRMESVLAAGYRLGIPVTCHIGIGQDIIHQHPNFDGAAYGAASDCDFLRFAKVVENLTHGVVMNFGSAVMAPEVFLKALAMTRNIAAQNNQKIDRFSSLVCDLIKLPQDYRCEPEKSKPEYYFRPWKTMLVRTVEDGEKAFTYVAVTGIPCRNYGVPFRQIR